jgi:hypothetical protein
MCASFTQLYRHVSTCQSSFVTFLPITLRVYFRQHHAKPVNNIKLRLADRSVNLTTGFELEMLRLNQELRRVTVFVRSTRPSDGTGLVLNISGKTKTWKTVGATGRPLNFSSPASGAGKLNCVDYSWGS